MNKNSFLNHKVLSKSSLAVFFALCMVAGFLCSRALLSASMFLFGVNALWNIHPKKWLQQRWWLLGLAWIACYAISWFWSNDKAYWNGHLQTKLPLLLLPLAFGFLPAFTRKQLQIFTTGLCLILLSGIAYSVSFFMKNPAGYIAGYNVSSLIPTPAGNNHICFSMMIALSVVWCIYFLRLNDNKLLQSFIIICIIAFVFYLHLLSAKTGLAALYFFVFAWGVYLLLSRKILHGVIMFIMFFGGVYSAYKLLDTFKSRMGYSYYTYLQYEEGNTSVDYSDIGRVLSYKLAVVLIKQHPVVGVGTGDVFDEMGRAYEKYYPEVTREQWLIPHNQFLMILLAAGVFALLFFCWWLLVPLRLLRRDRSSFFFFGVWLMLIVFLLVDASLESQFGVFVFSFFLPWQRHELLSAKATL